MTFEIGFKNICQQSKVIYFNTSKRITQESAYRRTDFTQKHLKLTLKALKKDHPNIVWLALQISEHSLLAFLALN